MPYVLVGPGAPDRWTGSVTDGDAHGHGDEDDDEGDDARGDEGDGATDAEAGAAGRWRFLARRRSS